MPIAINTNRPSSVNSNTNNGPPRPTITSTRGGRTRSRSPAVSMMGGGGGGSSRMSGSPTGEHMNVSNPSSAAAAAAAAAAKAYSSGNSRWKPEDEPQPPHPPHPHPSDPYSHHNSYGGPPHHHPSSRSGPPTHPHHQYGYDSRGGWPAEDKYSGRPQEGSSSSSGPPPSSSRSYHYDPYSRGPPPPGSSSAMPPPPPSHDPVDSRYNSHHPRYDYPGGAGPGGSSSSSSSRHPSSHHRGGYDNRGHHQGAPPPPTPVQPQQQQHHPHPHPHHQQHHSSHYPPQPPPAPHHHSSQSHHSSSSQQHPPNAPHPSAPPPPAHHGSYAPQDYSSRYMSNSRGGDRRDHPSGSGSSSRGSSERAGGGVAKSPPQQPTLHGGPSSSSRSSSAGGGGTTLVIGGTTPIHVPKLAASSAAPGTGEGIDVSSPKVTSTTPLSTVAPTSPIERPSGRTASAPSIFRNRPGDDSSKSTRSHRQQSQHHHHQPPPSSRSGSGSLDGGNNSKNNRHGGHNSKNKDTTTTQEHDRNHQDLMFSLTPTTSFEELGKVVELKGGNRSNRGGDTTVLDDDGGGRPMDDDLHNKKSKTTSFRQRSPDPLYDTQLSADFLKPNSSLDIVPSFNILNESFEDSSTDGPNFFSLDSTLGQTASFGLMVGRTDSLGGGTTSGDPTQPILLRNSSGGNYSTQILTAGSGPGIGYSPVNSFGTVTAGFNNRRSGSNIMIVGGGSTTSVGGGGPTLDTSHYDAHQTPEGSSGTLFRSYSGVGGLGLASRSTGGPGPLDDSHLRMSVGSFGYSRSYGEPISPAGHYGSTRSHDMMDAHYSSYPSTSTAPNTTSNNNHHQPQLQNQPHQSHHHQHHPHSSSPHEESTSRSKSSSNHHHRTREMSPSFYTLLRKFRVAFKDCTFLLPGLKAAVLEHSSLDKEDSDEKSKWGQHRPYGYHSDPSPQDMVIARRRVECSVCAFGGNMNQEHSIDSQKEKNAKTSSRDSIFRDKDVGGSKKVPPTVTPSSTDMTSRGRVESTPARLLYEEKLADRYYENESRLSWEFEEEPPVEVPEHTSEYPTVPYNPRDNYDDDDDDDNYEIDDSSVHNNNEHDNVGGGKSANKGGKDSSSVKNDKNDKTQNESGDGSDNNHRNSPSPTPSGTKSRCGDSTSSPQAKMRYRCKLCGQPKQNHSCPFQQSLARSIGIMVYPAVNAFTADEPGVISAPLSEMNNFFDLIQKQDSQVGNTMGGSSSVAGGSTTAEVTPERGQHNSSTGSMGGGGSLSGGGPPTSSIVSPDSLRSGGNTSTSRQPPPQSSPSGSPYNQQHHHHPSSPYPDGHRSGGSRSRGGGGGGDNASISSGMRSPSSTSGKKRNHSQMHYSHNAPTGGLSSGGQPRTKINAETGKEDLVFLESMELKVEQFRNVSQSSLKTLRGIDAYKYPALPLPYAQRKRLSDNLYTLSSDVPELMAECAEVLRKARDTGMWDLAVAELMTQVIIILHCPPGDCRLDGLRKYLLTLGIAC